MYLLLSSKLKWCFQIYALRPAMKNLLKNLKNIVTSDAPILKIGRMPIAKA